MLTHCVMCLCGFVVIMSFVDAVDQGDAAGGTKSLDTAIAAVAKVLDDAPALTKPTLRPFLLRPLVTISVRCRLWKANGVNGIAAATALPSAATSQLHRLLTLTAVCTFEGVPVVEKGTALDQALACMPAVEKECGLEVVSASCICMSDCVCRQPNVECALDSAAMHAVASAVGYDCPWGVV